MCLKTAVVSDRIRRITLNRPESLNALNIELLSSLAETVDESNDEFDVLIIEGAGAAFTAGADLDEEDDAGDLFQEITRAVRSFDGIVIGKLDGWVVGGGFEWTLSFDICYATPETTFKMPESEIGVTITNGSSILLPLAIGSGKAKELIYTSREFDAREAEQLGLLAGVYESDRLEEKVKSVARDLIDSKSQTALRLNKHVLNHALDIEDIMQQEEIVNEYGHAIEDVNW
ncbi:enoyl-CoA hydratase/isomerase family protein [Natrinema sp. 74]|uniref:enoyl-CoA hydratase/isomerase family protein n=1 Tax=Natrinema sp. 74 TaxID=3384159 RepID=UPI0038D3ADE3